MTRPIEDLIRAQCQIYGKNDLALEQSEVEHYLKQLKNSWALTDDGKSIGRDFKFKNYYETMAFVNCAAMVAHQQDHHPDMTVSYNNCRIEYSTHSLGGLSANDFICAAKTNAMLSV